jgi:hypothetical protein
MKARMLLSSRFTFPLPAGAGVTSKGIKEWTATESAQDCTRRESSTALGYSATRNPCVGYLTLVS